MEWKCKLCSALLDTRAKSFAHYHLHHSHYSRISPLPCMYHNCICTFQSFNSLKAHVSRSHKDVHRLEREVEEHAYYSCNMCNFKQPFSEATLFGHLRSRLRKHEMVACPFKDCKYRTNVYSSFNAYKSRKHVGTSLFVDNVLLAEIDSTPITTSVDCDDGPSQCESSAFLDLSEVESQCDTDDLRAQLHHNLASLFLKMQTVLHISNMAIQEIVEHLTQIFCLSQPLVKKTIRDALQSHDIPGTEASLDQVVSAVMESNIFTCATAKCEDLSSTKRRKSYIEKKSPVVKPVQYVLEPGHTVVHVSILEMIQVIFRHTDILDRIKETKTALKGHYVSHQDGSYFKGNDLLSSLEELKLHLLLYTDDLEIANPLGTSRKIHKLTAVYWVPADLPSKNRSALHVIQLAALCKVSDIQKFGYERVLGPLLKDICTLEQDGVFIESMGKAVQGTVMCVVNGDLLVKDFLERWPALRMESQIFAEFHRITNVNLRNQFYTELDQHTPRLISLFRQKALQTGKRAVVLREILGTYDCQEENDVSVRRTMALQALPVYLREDDSEFFKTYNQEEEPDITDIPVALLMAGADPFSSKSFFVVGEHCCE